jgi:20S proteasome alpha/beta subunit
MGKIIVKNVITRKPGHLYYVDGAGNVCEAKMARGGKRKKGAKKVVKKKVAKKPVKKVVKKKVVKKKKK